MTPAEREAKKRQIMQIIKRKHPNGTRTVDIDRKIFPPSGIPHNNKTYRLIAELRDEGKIKGTVERSSDHPEGSPWILAE